MRTCDALRCFSLCLWFLCGPMNTYGQQNVPSSTQLKKPITELLLEYQRLTESLIAQNQSLWMGSIIRLFHNPKVQIVDDLDAGVSSAFLPIEDYLQKLILRFPMGKGFSLKIDDIRIFKPRFDPFLERYLVDVWVLIEQPGYSGKDIGTTPRIFTIGFNYSDQNASDFLIMGINYYHPRPQYATFSVSPMLSRFHNYELGGDERFELKWTPGFQSAISYHQLLTDHLGVGIGLGIAMFNNVLVLDHFDPWLAFDPHMEEVNFCNRIWTLELPVMIDYWLAKEGVLRPYLHLGLVGSARFYETSATLATQSLTGTRVESVVTDPSWYEELNRFNLRCVAGAGLFIRTRGSWSFDLGLRYDQGITALDHRTDLLFDYHRYTGQNNPLWAEPERFTLVQAWRLHVGIVYLLNE